MTELFSVPINDLQRVPITENHHKWLLLWYRTGNGNFGFSFVSPKKRRYFFFVMRGERGKRVIDTDVSLANGKTIASYWGSWGDKPDKMDAVLRLTPKHIIDRLYMLLDAIG